MNIGSALMSRFDLFFVVLDDCDKQIDTLLAQHIVNVHRSEAEFLKPPFSSKELNVYIKYAHTIKPMVLEAFPHFFIACYLSVYLVSHKTE